MQVESDGLRSESLTEAEIGEAVSALDPVWETLTPSEQGRLVGLLVQRVDYDGSNGRVAITFHAAGIKALADEVAGKKPALAS